MVRAVLITSLLAALYAPASANGRPPGSSTINFQRNSSTNIIAGMTFGVVFSRDGGATWTWECEDAVGYGGMYDPDYAVLDNGTFFATTFDGLKVNHDGCVYELSTLAPPAPAIKFFSTITVGPDNALYAASVDDNDNFIYKSTDGGATFPIKATAGQLKDWRQTIEVAPSDPQIVYVSGYRLASGQPRLHQLFKSIDGGASYSALPLTGIAAMSNSTLELVGISKTNANLVYLRVALSDNIKSDAIYRSVNGGTSWTKIFEKAGAVSFVVRASGELVAGTQVLGTFKATDTGGATAPTFTEVAGAPHINCLAESPAGEVFACTQNYGAPPQLPSDDAGIMKTTDLVSWTKVLRFEDIQDPVSCPAGTPQHDKCDAVNWCPLCNQLGCTANRDCGVVGGDSGGGDNTMVNTKDPTGCGCQSGNGGLVGFVVLGAMVGLVTLRRRRCCRP